MSLSVLDSTEIRQFYLSMSGLFHLVECPQVLSMLGQMSGFPSLFWLNVALYVYIHMHTPPLIMHSSVDILDCFQS